MEAFLPLLAGLGTGLALIVAIGVQNTYLLRLAVSSGLRVVAAAVVVCAVSDAVLILAGVLGVGVVVERFPVALVVIRFVGAAFLLTYGVLAARRALRPSGDTMQVDPGPTDAVPIDVGAPDAPSTAAADRGAAVAIAPPGGRRAPADEGAMSAAGRDSTRRAPAAAPVASAAPSPPAASTAAVDPAAPLTDATPPDPGAARPRRAATPGRSEVTMRTAVVTMLVFTWANPHVYLDTLVFLGSVANQQAADDRWWWTAGAVAASCLWFGALGFGGRLLRPLFARPTTWRVFDGLVALVMLGFGVALLVGT